MYFEDSSLGVHLFSIIMSSWQSYPFILTKCLPWPQVILLILKSDIIRATPAFLSLMIELCIFCLFTSTYLYIWLWDIYLNILNIFRYSFSEIFIQLYWMNSLNWENAFIGMVGSRSINLIFFPVLLFFLLSVYSLG